ncbi:MAG TPA: 16S rRNA (guanine(966)-N(2))-methyltransferase RsmD [Acidimicrobiales bacterium]
MRVVGGTARGRRLVAPPGDATRPTTDRVREAVFNALASRGLVVDARVLDLFAGSGALGVEALSRGAAHVTFVDDDPRARRAVAKNLAATGFADRAAVVADRAERFLARYDGPPFDLAFCDPPYAFTAWDELLSVLPAAFVVVETAAGPTLPAPWEVVRSTRYGRSWVTFGANTSLEGGGE